MALFDGHRGLGPGAFDGAALRQALVAQHTQCFDFRPLAAAFAVLQDLDVLRARHAVFVNDAFLLDLRTPQHQQLADVLHGRCAQVGAEGLVNEFPASTVVRENADLDQPVGVQGGIDFFLYGCSQAVAADHDHGVKVVGIGTVFPAFGWGQFNMRHGAYYPARKQALEISMKTKTKSSKVNKAWLNQHVNDPYVKAAQKDGYRARAAYKLKEIDEQWHLIQPGATVVDLGCAPGAWSQYLRRRLAAGGAAPGQGGGTIIGVDLLPMEPIEGVTYIQGDFREEAVLAQLQAALGGRLADVVVSDMAPNLSGVASVDGVRVAHLIELAVDFAQHHMKREGALVVKLFHGSGYNELVQLFKANFHTVKTCKPKASRPQSAETFLIGMGLKTV